VLYAFDFGVGWAVTGLAGLMFLVSVLAGFYPAVLLSGFQPVVTLKGTVQSGMRGAWLRKGLVITQFALSIFLVVGTLIIYQQLQYMHANRISSQYPILSTRRP